MHPALLDLVTIIMGVGGCVGYFWLSNFVLDTSFTRHVGQMPGAISIVPTHSPLAFPVSCALCAKHLSGLSGG